MQKLLFFDDNKLFGIDNVERRYGKPELISVYNDGVCSTDYCTGSVFRLDNGKYRMIYFGHSNEYSGKKLFSAVSDDGVNFLPEKLYNSKADSHRMYEHEIMDIPGEVAFIYEDRNSQNTEERYKLLMSDHGLLGKELRVNDTIYVSPDLINWNLKENVYWGDGAEPLASVFYNKHKNVHTILERPFWGIRCVGYKETKDWENFTEYNLCLNVDSNDERLAEIYGMFAFEYDGMYIGIPHIYRHLNSELNAKYKNGIIDTQLAYSYDGRYWQRSLREAFISGIDSKPDNLNINHNLVWVSNMQIHDDGNVYFYASASELEHGPAFHEPGTGKMLIYKMRRDGFISLSTQDKEKTSSLATREKVWHGGEVHLNIKSKNATVAVYVSDESEMVAGNALGIAKPIDGYGHEDCISFSGDSVDWVPQYKTGKKIEELKGKTLVFELRFEDGEVFSLSGDYTDVYNTQAVRYRKLGILPE